MMIMMIAKIMIAKIMTMIMIMSITIVRANALCLLSRLSQLGPGAGAATRCAEAGGEAAARPRGL